MKMRICLNFLFSLTVLLGMFGCVNSRVYSDHRAVATYHAIERYPDHSIDERARAAKQLAQMDDASDWIVLILTYPAAIDEPGLTRSSAEMWKSSSNDYYHEYYYIVGVIIQNLPEKNASPAVLWALTEYLQGFRTGWVELTDHTVVTTGQLSDSAHKKLQENLNVDYGDDVQLWREAIVERAIKEK